MAEETAPAHPVRALGKPLAATISVVASLIGLIVLAWAILFVTKGRFLKGPFERIVSSQTERQVKVGGDFQLYFAPFNVKFLAEDISVTNPAWAKGRFFEARKVDSVISTWSLITGNRRINWLSLDGAHLDLAWDEKHRRNTWTLGNPDKKGEPLDLPLIRAARAAGTEIRYSDPAMALMAAIGLEPVEASQSKFSTAIRFEGRGLARGTRFTVSGGLLTPNATAGGGENKLELHIRGANTVADVTGTLPGATEIEGANLHVDVRGGNLADLFSVLGVAVPDTRSYRMRSALTKRGPEWRFTGMKGRFGASDLSGKFTIENRQPRLMITAALDTRVLDIVDAGPFIGYNPNRLAAQGAITTVNGAPRVLPDAPLRAEALKNFDARVDWHVRAVRAPGLPSISDITLGLALDDRLLTLSPLNFALSRGRISSDIVINARDPRVLTDYDIRLSPTPMGTLLAGFGVAEAGTSGTIKARAQLKGTGDTVHDSLSTANGRIAFIIPKGSLWTRNVQLSELDIGVFIQKMFEKKLKEPVQINCGLIAFTVRNGIGAADPILIDTAGNVVAGRGGFSFKNESLDLAIEADSKKFSLFSGQSPVGIGGWFAAPRINPISGELVARAGIGLGIGALVSPIGAIISFVDVGDAKAADCGPVLAGASAHRQRDTKGRPRDDVGKGTTAKSESGKQSKGERREQRKKFLGIF
ncbi:AsmA family protein [Sphingomonas sp. G-3-2-10]|uniref:AsmA family protein n=1 Tax=Sphingomonas sp. G-3-2-10 TaxID=2728838 RepID=UPI001469F9DB|nr:AsmA family protein [Sphingomonas sp. G-3-2-10]NML07203.1 AsmA family protein [Sphingomonas sp. G-3-2-10]